jgi:glycosyltransferase involved in cell wall biosynthesis
MIKLSILIPTHKRAELFKRCINKLLEEGLPNYVEIIVNNDSEDIEEIKHPKIKYLYYKSNNLAEIYKVLLDNANGKYSYILEDDDYIMPGFFDKIKLKNSFYLFMPHSGIKGFKKFSKIWNEFNKTLKISGYNVNKLQESFQFSQIIFETSFKTLLPFDNNIHNDFIFFKKMLDKTDFLFVNKTIFKQTCDAKDNISFPEYNKDKRFKG